MGQILIIAGGVFLLGAVLLLERRCLGKTAFVQPLVLCLLAGIIFDVEDIGLWFGISLQLLSIGQSHYCNWVLASIISSASLVVLSHFGIDVVPGDPTSMVILCTGILLGIFADALERKLHRNAVVEMQGTTLWKSEDGIEAFARLIYRRIFVGFLYGGVQSMVGVALATALAYVVYVKISLHLPVAMPAIVAMIVPTFGVAITLGSLSGRRYPFFAGIGVLVTIGFWMAV